MSANRDKSQGFGFVYVDPAAVIREYSHRPLTPDTAPAKPKSKRAEALKELHANLDRLQTLHRKLNGMLEELAALVDRKK